MEVEPVLSGFIVEDKSNSEENDEEVPKTFPGHEALPSVSSRNTILCKPIEIIKFKEKQKINIDNFLFERIGCQ